MTRRNSLATMPRVGESISLPELIAIRPSRVFQAASIRSRARRSALLCLLLVLVVVLLGKRFARFFPLIHHR